MSNTAAQSPGNDRLLTVDELARWVRVPKSTIYQWNHRRVGPTFMRVGRHVRYRRSDVEEWLFDRETTGVRS